AAPRTQAHHVLDRRPRGRGAREHDARRRRQVRRRRDPRLLLRAQARRARGGLPHVPRRHRGHSQAPDGLLDPRQGRHGRPHADPAGQGRAAVRGGVPADQPPARLPRLRQGRRVPVAGRVLRLGRRHDPLRRAQAPLQEAAGALAADRDRPRALHPLLPLRALLPGAQRGLPARAARALGRDVRRHLRRASLRRAVQREHPRAVSRRRADLHAVPLPRAALGHRERGLGLHAVPRAVQRRLHGSRRPRAARPGARERGGRRRLALRQGPLRLPVDPRGGARRRAHGPRGRRAARGHLGACAGGGQGGAGRRSGPDRGPGRRRDDQRGGLPPPAPRARRARLPPRRLRRGAGSLRAARPGRPGAAGDRGRPRVRPHGPGARHGARRRRADPGPAAAQGRAPQPRQACGGDVASLVAGPERHARGPLRARSRGRLRHRAQRRVLRRRRRRARAGRGGRRRRRPRASDAAAHERRRPARRRRGALRAAGARRGRGGHGAAAEARGRPRPVGSPGRGAARRSHRDERPGAARGGRAARRGARPDRGPLRRARRHGHRRSDRRGRALGPLPPAHRPPARRAAARGVGARAGGGDARHRPRGLSHRDDPGARDRRVPRGVLRGEGGHPRPSRRSPSAPAPRDRAARRRARGVAGARRARAFRGRRARRPHRALGDATALRRRGVLRRAERRRDRRQGRALVGGRRARRGVAAGERAPRGHQRPRGQDAVVEDAGLRGGADPLRARGSRRRDERCAPARHVPVDLGCGRGRGVTGAEVPAPAPARRAVAGGRRAPGHRARRARDGRQRRRHGRSGRAPAQRVARRQRVPAERHPRGRGQRPAGAPRRDPEGHAQV
ncbi:MAG: NADH-ubiquinone oxidoreductase chain G, partial [uncultured Solirubrobacteraceae bacterium]